MIPASIVIADSPLTSFSLVRTITPKLTTIIDKVYY